MNRIILISIILVSLAVSQNSESFLEPDFIDTQIQGTFSGTISVQNDVEYSWEWSGDPQWLTSVNTGIYNGVNLLGSTLGNSDLVPVKIIFTTSDTTFCQTYRRDLGYPAGGVGIFSGSAWDMSDTENPRRLNICLVEDNNQKEANLLWDPNNNSLGGREYFFVMLSSYDGNGLTYNNENWGPASDNLYGGWLKIPEGRTLFEADPAEINIYLRYITGFFAIPGEESNLLKWQIEDINIDELKIYYGLSSPANTFLTTLTGNERSFLHEGLINNTSYFYRIEALNDNQVLTESVEIVSEARPMGENMELLGNLHSYSTYGDIWGYTDSSGTEYALLCARNNGLSIIDITNSPPVEVGFVPSIYPGSSDSKDVKVYENYAFLINENAPIQIIDLSDPGNPQTVQTIELESGSGSHNCYVYNGYLFVVGNHIIGGMEIFDITNPLSPLRVGSFEPFYYHDVYVRNDTAFAAGIYGNGIDIIDVSSVEEPSLIARFNYPNSGAHNVWTTEDGRYVFVGDEIGHAGNHTRVFDISDTENIEYVADIIIDSSAIAHNCYVKGDLLFIGHYTEGVRVFDVSNPEIPVEIAYYDTYPPNAYGYLGTWSVYPFFESGKIIASDMQTGLYVMQMSNNPTAITRKTSRYIPSTVELDQNFPNPFNPSTIISFYLPKTSEVTVKIYDSLGRVVDELVSDKLSSGSHNIRWIAKDVAAGVYFYQLKSDDFTLTRKMVLLK